MERVRTFVRSEPLISALLLAAVSALVYLPFIGQFGYYQDDWYSMYAARVRGAQAFVGIFSIDRPGRAYLMGPLYALFGGDPLYYNISAYIFRLAGGLSLLWLLRMLWPGRRWETFFAALLFLVYPGFLSEPIAIDYQSHIVAIFLGLFSLALTVRAFFSSAWLPRFLLLSAACLSGWGYLSQMEYYIGFELVRIGLVTLLVLRNRPLSLQSLKQIFLAYLPYLAIPAAFLAWRLLLFQNVRSDTDVNLQLGRFLGSPLYTGLGWLVNLLQDIINVLFAGWAIPLAKLGFDETTPLVLPVLAILASILLLLVIEFFGRQRIWEQPQAAPTSWRREAILLGLLWILAGLLPVTLSNNHITFFPDYSRYGLISSPGGAILWVTILGSIGLRPVRAALVGFLLFSAILTHLSNGWAFAQSFSDIKGFWWQTSWRIPDLERGTTIIAHYPRGGIRENSFVWGPASHIYYAEKLNQNGTVTTSVAALYLDEQTVLRVLDGASQVLDERRGVESYPNYRNILILTQPGPDACVQVIDGKQPVYSRNEYDAIMLIGDHSEPQHILVGASPRTPPAFLFDEEPAHGWCFYYEKAALARQKGDWESVRSIGQQAFSLGLLPTDQVEWMPFLQAYAALGDSGQLAKSSSYLTDPFVRRQACRLLGEGELPAAAIKTQVQELFCAP